MSSKLSLMDNIKFANVILVQSPLISSLKDNISDSANISFSDNELTRAPTDDAVPIPSLPSDPLILND